MPRHDPRTAAASSTARVCKVIGTGTMGTVTWADRAIRAVKTGIKTRDGSGRMALTTTDSPDAQLSKRGLTKLIGPSISALTSLDRRPTAPIEAAALDGPPLFYCSGPNALRAKTAEDRHLLELIDPIAASLGLAVVRVRLMGGTLRRRLWLKVVAFGWLASAVVLAASIGSTWFGVIAGMTLLLLMALPGAYMLRRQPG